MKIVKNFPLYNLKDKVKVICPETKRWVSGTVIGTWYPKKRDVWSETEECKHIGYLNSDPDKPFPQLLVLIRSGKNKSKHLKLHGEEQDEIKLNK